MSSTVPLTESVVQSTMVFLPASGLMESVPEDVHVECVGRAVAVAGVRIGGADEVAREGAHLDAGLALRLGRALGVGRAGGIRAAIERGRDSTFAVHRLGLTKRRAL